MQRILLLVLAMVAACGPVRAACLTQQRATVPFTLTDGHLLVPVMVNGIRASFVLDTGAERSLVTPDAVGRLRLALDKWVDTTMRGVGGVVQHANADPRSLSLGDLPLRRHTITHDVSLTVGNLAVPQVDGLLGRDFLSPYDLQLDMATHQLTLFTVTGCHGRFVPWASGYDTVSATSPIGNALVLPIMLDGRRLSALLDTGASASMLTLPGTIRMGLTPALLAHDRTGTMRGVGPQVPQTYRHRFARLQVGSQTRTDALLWVAAVRTVPIVDALLGADWLAEQSRIWISFATRQVFFVPR